MPDLTSLLVRDQIVPVRAIEDAIARQAISGGTLESVLLERDLVRENVLASYVAATYDLLPARRDDVMNPSAEAFEKLSSELALQHRVVPVSVRGEDLVVASATPINEATILAIEAEIGRRFIVQIALEVRIAAALAEHYGAELSPRVRQLVERLALKSGGDVRPVVATSARPPRASNRPERTIRVFEDDRPSDPAPPTVVGIPSPEPVRPSSPPREVEPVASPTLSGSRSTEDGLSATISSRRLVDTAKTILMTQLSNAESRDDVLAALLAFAAQFFDYVALFSVGDEVAEGRDAAGEGAPADVVRKIKHPLHDGLLARARRSGAPCVGDLAHADVDHTLAHALARSAQHPSACVPISIRGRVVLLLWGDRSQTAFEPAVLSDLFTAIAQVGHTLERLIRARKLSDWRSSVQPTRPGDLPAALLDAANPALTPTPAELESPTHKARALGTLGTRTAPPPPVLLHDTAEGPVPLVQTSPPPALRDSIPELKPARMMSAPPPPPPPAHSAPPSAGRISYSDLRREDDDFAGAPKMDVIEPRRVSRVSAPMSRGSSQPPLRSVIVDMGSDVDAMVKRLVQGDREGIDAVIESLLEVGERALPVLVQNFPGPIWLDLESLSADKPPLARDVGPIPRAMLAFRLRAASYVAALIETDVAVTRKVAVLLAGEILSPLLVGPLGRRLLDVDLPIARLAVHVLPRFSRASEYSALLVNLRATLTASSVSIDVKLRGIWAAAELRDSASVPVLLDLLDSDQEAIVLEAERALITLTRQDLGRGRKRWDAWAQKNLSLHRVEWLIEGLLHPEEQMRNESSEELKRITQEYFGYHPGAARKDRERVHKRYLEWWQAEGHRRFRQ